MKQILIGWLAAQGIVLANDASDHSVIEAVQKIATSKAVEVTALGNEKTTLSGQITALTNEKTTLTTKLTEAQTALANANTLVTGLKTSRAGYVVDLAIHQGRLAVADRDTRIAALGNSADFEKDAKALLAEAVKFKVGGDSSVSGKALANAAMPDPREQLLGKVGEKMKAAGMDYATAHAAVLKENPALGEQLKTRQPTAA